MEHENNKILVIMRQIYEYLLGKSNTKLAATDFEDPASWETYLDMNFPDDKKPRTTKDGKPYLWWRSYELLCKEGPMSKKEILRKFGLQETSYSTEFAKISAMNIIIPNTKTRKLQPMPPSEWKLNKTMTHTKYSSYATYSK